MHMNVLVIPSKFDDRFQVCGETDMLDEYQDEKFDYYYQADFGIYLKDGKEVGRCNIGNANIDWETTMRNLNAIVDDDGWHDKYTEEELRRKWELKDKAELEEVCEKARARFVEILEWNRGRDGIIMDCHY